MYVCMYSEDMSTQMSTITATDGRKATAPTGFATKWSQKNIDSIVMQAHRGGVADRATCRAIGVVAITED